jgi:DNA primase
VKVNPRVHGLLLSVVRRPISGTSYTWVPQKTNKRNHNSISTSPIPLPQTTAITCLSDHAPTNQLATLSQDQQATRARHTQDTLPGTRKRTRSQTESQKHTPLTQIIDTVALNSQIEIQPTEQPTNSQPNKRTTHSQITSHDHHATQAFTQITTPPTQHINIINPITYQIHNNPTFEIAHHPASSSSQHRPQRKRRCEVLDIPHNLPSLNLTPLHTTHIQQELWTYKKDKAFSMTPTEAINTLYYDDMDILHIDNWRFFTPKKRDRDDTPLRQKQFTMPL